jgi:hypothetical protein
MAVTPKANKAKVPEFCGGTSVTSFDVPVSSSFPLCFHPSLSSELGFFQKKLPVKSKVQVQVQFIKMWRDVLLPQAYFLCEMKSRWEKGPSYVVLYVYIDPKGLSSTENGPITGFQSLYDKEVLS